MIRSDLWGLLTIVKEKIIHDTYYNSKAGFFFRTFEIDIETNAVGLWCKGERLCLNPDTIRKSGNFLRSGSVCVCGGDWWGGNYWGNIKGRGGTLAKLLSLDCHWRQARMIGHHLENGEDGDPNEQGDVGNGFWLNWLSGTLLLRTCPRTEVSWSRAQRIRIRVWSRRES